MGRFSIKGRDATSFLNHVLPTDASKVRIGRAFYSTICNEHGGIIDDTVTNKLSETDYLMVVNASNRDKDMKWLEESHANFSVELKDLSNDIALIAFQGPLASELLQKVSDSDLSQIKRFAVEKCKVMGYECLLSRTGYTGE